MIEQYDWLGGNELAVRSTIDCQYCRPNVSARIEIFIVTMLW